MGLVGGIRDVLGAWGGACGTLLQVKHRAAGADAAGELGWRCRAAAQQLQQWSYQVLLEVLVGLTLALGDTKGLATDCL